MKKQSTAIKATTSTTRIIIEGANETRFSVCLDGLSNMLRRIGERSNFRDEFEIFQALDWIYDQLVENSPNDTNLEELKSYLFLLKDLMYGLCETVEQVKN